jgi:hypothetical protein
MPTATVSLQLLDADTQSSTVNPEQDDSESKLRGALRFLHVCGVSVCRAIAPETSPLALALLFLVHVLALGTLAAIFYSPAAAYSAIPSPWGRDAQLVYSVLSRPIWASALATLLFLCFTGEACSFVYE